MLPSGSEVDELRAEVEQLKGWIAASQQAVAEPSGPKPLAVAAAPPIPDDDDDDDDIALLVTKAADNDGVSARNFLDSAFNLVQ